MFIVDCELVREAVSARADGERHRLSDRSLARHLSRCPSCAAFAAEVEALARRTRLRAAEEAPDLTGRVVATQVTASGRGWVAVRVALGVVAAAELATAVPALVFGDVVGAQPHVARHLGAFAAAVAVALLVVAARPARARALLPLTATLAAGLTVGGLVDAGREATSGLGELHHLVEVVGLVLVWILAVPARWPGTSRPGRHRAVAPLLRPVEGRGGSSRAEGGSAERAGNRAAS